MVPRIKPELELLATIGGKTRGRAPKDIGKLRREQRELRGVPGVGRQ